MKASDRGILMALLLVGLLAGIYFMVLAPKREQASALGEEISSLQASIDEEEQVAVFAEQARQEFPEFYSRVVVLGKAVPEQADSASMLVQLNSIANRSDVEFRGIELAEGSGAAEAAPAPAPPAPADPNAAPPPEGAPLPAESVPTGSTPTATEVPVPATEAAAASLPIGATVGPAGFPTLPYGLSLKGSFFDLADYMAGIDSLVDLKSASGQVAADGRLLTVDGFAFEGGAPGSSPELAAFFAVTSYVTPEAQGLTLGATPGGPAPALPPTTPATSVTP